MDELLESSGGAQPRQGRAVGPCALDHGRQGLAHAGHQRGSTFRRGQRRGAGHPIATGVRDEVGKDAAAGAIRIVGRGEPIEMHVLWREEAQERSLRFIGMPISRVMTKLALEFRR